MAIQGIDIEVRQVVGSTGIEYDWAGQPIYQTEWVKVSDVLVGEPTTDDVTQTLDLYGKRVAYMLAIPKGDRHIWENTQVRLPEPFAGIYNTVRVPTAGIEANIPLRWNKKVKLERYVQDEN